MLITVETSPKLDAADVRSRLAFLRRRKNSTCVHGNSLEKALRNNSPAISEMAAKGGKSSKKEDASASLTLAAITMLLKERHVVLATEFKTSFSQLNSKLDQTRLAVEDHGQRVSSLELAAEDLSQQLIDLEGICSTPSNDNARLKAKVTKLDSQSSRQNIRILGLLESIKSGSPTEFFSKLLCKVYGNNTLPSPPEIGRAHCFLASKPAARQRPGPVILRLHQYQTKDLLIREARQRGKLEYHSQPVRVVEDYSPEVLSQRAEHSGVMAELYELDLKPALLYPKRHCPVEPESESTPWTRHRSHCDYFITFLVK
ncbi:hypothetical protein L3Q82_007052 [Scortum barcoo]|uniref:Uncharacterized protein n=1 Tax=Scortum barcoo TaxID=214431 RepID=A0ACB8WWN9_9TELE|nr:hypothetical protein L3Q82_007052 [Scortum barcoo]